MDRTTATNYTTDANGHRIFQDRNLSTGQPGTTQTALDHTAYQEEILGPVEFAGITPDATNNKQLLQAMLALKMPHMVVFTTSGAMLDGSAITWTNGGLWTVPPGITRIKLRAVGGGGASAAFVGGNASMPGCGGGGGYFEGIYTVVPGTTYAVTVGAGGTGGAGNGATGAATSFGSIATALGGSGGITGANPAGGMGGLATGGLINIQGGDGTDGIYIAGVTTDSNIQSGAGIGGSTPLGNGGRSGAASGTGGYGGRGYGGGAGAPYDGVSTNINGGSGAPGVVIVEY